MRIKVRAVVYIICFFISVFCFACTLTPHHLRNSDSAKKKVSIKEYIDKEVMGYMEEREFANRGRNGANKNGKKQPGLDYSFDNSVILKIPPNMPVHSNPSKVEYKTPSGRFTTYLPKRWELWVFENDESMILYDLNEDNHPAFPELEMLPGGTN